MTDVILACALTLLAGLVKGSVGFGLPAMMISSLSLLMAPEAALGALILPALMTNGWQALRGGVQAMMIAIRDFGPFLAALVVTLFAAAQLVPYLSAGVMLLLIGVPVCLFAVMALSGRRLPISENPGPRMQGLVGALTGFCGGVTGVWGPPTVALLSAMNTPKEHSVRIQGVIYAMGAVMLVLGHLVSGVFDRESMQLSALLCVPALLGMWIGFQVQDRLSQEAFMRLTHLVLLIVSIYLIFKGISLL